MLQRRVVLTDQKRHLAPVTTRDALLPPCRELLHNLSVRSTSVDASQPSGSRVSQEYRQRRRDSLLKNGDLPLFPRRNRGCSHACDTAAPGNDPKSVWTPSG